MKCDAVFCRFWNDFACSLNDVELDHSGKCKEKKDIPMREAVNLKEKIRLLNEILDQDFR